MKSKREHSWTQMVWAHFWSFWYCSLVVIYDAVSWAFGLPSKFAIKIKAILR